MLINLKMSTVKLLRRVLNRYSVAKLKANKELWNEIQKFKDKNLTTGCSWIDLWTLYDAVRTRKPKEILELGPGLSTIAMGYALQENEKEGNIGKITSMEENDYYFDSVVKNFPDSIRNYVEFYLSPKMEKSFYLFRGVKYKDIPPKKYDFVFVDGPTLDAPSDGMLTFDYDLIDVVKESESAVFGIVDYRLTTSFVFQTIFGFDKVRFCAIKELCFVGPVEKKDLLEISLSGLTETFNKTFSFGKSTRIRLK